MNHKIGRNDPCWCGSGIKYKKCHLNRDKQNPLDTWETARAVKKEFDKKLCLAPKGHHQQCAGKIINAHTISKSSCLKAIARNSLVYEFLPTLERHVKYRLNNGYGVIEPELGGINKSSTFTGFCKTHDNLLFSPLENKEFIASREQVFLLAYRTLARELFGKTAYMGIVPILRQGDSGRSPLEQQSYQKNLDYSMMGSDAALKDLIYQKQQFDEMLIANDFSDIEGFVIKFKRIPSIMCSSAIFPECDFHGNAMQDFLDLDKRLSVLYTNVIATGDSGYVVFSWLKKDDVVCRKFIESLCKHDAHRITDAIVRLMFNFFENKFANPDWWESLPSQKRLLLNTIFHHSVSHETDRDPDCLIEDHMEYDDWEVDYMTYI